MGEFRITAGDYSADIVARGAGLRAVRHGDRLLTETWDAAEVLATEGGKPPLSAGLVLAPWPNRTADGRYTFDGVDHQLEITETARNNANHGFVRTVEWNLHEVTDRSVTLGVPIGRHPGWPFDLTLVAEYALDADTGLTVTVTVTNVGDTTAPFALGIHTFVRAGDADIDDCTLQLAGASTLPLDPERQLPAGDPTPVAGTDLDFSSPRRVDGVWMDTPFTDMAVEPSGSGDRHRNRLTAPDGGTTELWTDLGFGWAQVFTADPAHDQAFPGRGRALAIEPMTAPPNALASGTDLIVCAPGQMWSGTWGLAHHAAGVR
ncbi:aldose epimerase [Williamsia sp. Leaf354]|uniref:aldose 1-epimerase family protein n=1 Tax=Williamsia sp. Leaf354 TaxID=1736349 RepID=UPI0006F4D6BE|nr:aldose 1-epimerase family protein [Williamsia sp. Leaf354]KQS00644.1 aldose epimerase [Williamsia sp. Leaf354]